MSPENPASETGPLDFVAVDRWIGARPETVFRILADPMLFSRWIGGRAEFEPRVGSPFRITFPQFATTVQGEILELEPASRFVVSWGVSEGGQADWMPAGSTRVTIAVRPEEGGTRVELRHDDLPTEQEARNHAGGWRFHLCNLELQANRDHLKAILPDLLRAWAEAWEEGDDQRRATLLSACVAPDLVYSDEYATLEGRDRLDTHIANTQRYVPGARLIPTGEPRINRGDVLFDWRVEGPQGTLFAGTSWCRMGSEDRIVRMVGFTNASG